MVLASLHTDALRGLCPKDQLDLLDSVDRLRSQGINHYVSLPQIIVCGDQSSGKSSVLEAVSGVSFPIKSTLCTRFPTELVLRNSSHESVSVSIVPHHSRPEAEKASLACFRESLQSLDGFADLVDKAKTAMGISAHGKTFSKDLLRVEITGRGRPHLTIVDLPGLIHSETKQQSASDVELIQDVVQSYMREPRSIILAVVSAKNDYANQIVLKLARAADQTGYRTLGVITKPDTLIPTSASEAMYVSLARNQDVEFRLGWHVLKNADSETGTWTLAERNKEEARFLSQGVWAGMPRSLLGIEHFRSRLSQVLLGQIAAELPSLVQEIEAKSDACRTLLARLGQPRATLDEQRGYLLQVSQHFQSLVKASVDGTYNDAFFGDAGPKRGYQKRIRAVVQNLNREFAENLARRGHRRQITTTSNDSLVPHGVIAITRDKFVDEVQDLMKRTCGRELPGTFNPMILANLFATQSGPWEEIVRTHVDKVWTAVRAFLGLVVAHVADAATSQALMRNIVEPQLDEILSNLKTSFGELLKPHQEGHPITYSGDFIESLGKLRYERMHQQFASVIKTFFNVSSLEPGSIVLAYGTRHDLGTLVESLLKDTNTDMDRFAASEALDCLEAYYKVAMKRFIDDIAIQVIEFQLIATLGNILSPIKVFGMDSDLVALVAGESEETRTARDEASGQLAILQAGLETCKHFISVRLPDSDHDAAQLDSGSDGAQERSHQAERLINDSAADEVVPGEVPSAQGSTSKGDMTPPAECRPEPEPEPKPPALKESDGMWDFSAAKEKKKKKKKAAAFIWDEVEQPKKADESDWP